MNISEKKPEKHVIEELLHSEITQDLFSRALDAATKKQRRIYADTDRDYVMEDWYLVQLTKEAVIEISFQDFSLELCRVLNDMKKERLSQHGISTPTDTHIVPAFS